MGKSEIILGTRVYGRKFLRERRGIAGIFPGDGWQNCQQFLSKMLENAGKQEENGGKLCQPFAGVLLGIGGKMVSSFLSAVVFKIAVVVLKDWCRDWCRLFWKIIILLLGNFK